MKKVLALLIVLGLCNSAFALLSIQPILSGTAQDPVTEIWVEESEVFYVDLLWVNDFAEGFGPPGELSAADISIVITGAASVADIETLTFNVDYTGAAGTYNGPFVVPGGIGLSVTSWSNGANPGEVIIDHIGFHCDMAPSEVTIVAFVNGQPVQGGAYVDWAYPLDTGQGGPGTVQVPLIVHQIPEPMTVALLGLGGLFLLRRRK